MALTPEQKKHYLLRDLMSDRFYNLCGEPDTDAIRAADHKDQAIENPAPNDTYGISNGSKLE